MYFQNKTIGIKEYVRFVSIILRQQSNVTLEENTFFGLEIV